VNSEGDAQTTKWTEIQDSSAQDPNGDEIENGRSDRFTFNREFISLMISNAKASPCDLIGTIFAVSRS
jgi:hypothetical protein